MNICDPITLISITLNYTVKVLFFLQRRHSVRPLFPVVDHVCFSGFENESMFSPTVQSSAGKVISAFKLPIGVNMCVNGRMTLCVIFLIHSDMIVSVL